MWKKILGKFWRKTPSIIRRKTIRFTQTKFTVSVGAVVVNGEGKVLLLDHVFRPASGWGIPGGFIEAGEPPEKAVRRELCEEIGLELENVELYQAQTLDRHVEILFRARARGKGAVKSFEINRIGWFEINRLPAKMNRSQKQIIEEILTAGDVPKQKPDSRN
ncbi:MAG: NUDIX hydrolase [Pyrinomonadaceae bacterium]